VPRLAFPPPDFSGLDGTDEVRREPQIPVLPPVSDHEVDGDDPDPVLATRPAGPIERDPQIKGNWWVRLRGPIGSLALHLLPLLLLLHWEMPPPPEVTPIAVQLVMEPPPPEVKPPPPPEVKPTPPKPETKPPPGRIASDDFGNPDAKETGHEESADSAAKDAPAPPEAAPSEAPPQKTAAIVPPPPPEKPNPPRDAVPAPKPPPKPNPVAHQPPQRVEETAHTAPRRARFPGPDATRDEYLAYLLSLTRQHLNLLTLSMVGDRRGVTVIKILVLDDGTIARLRVGQSSGYQDIDSRVEQIIMAVGHFPPLPQWFQGEGMEFEFELHFPGALRE